MKEKALTNKDDRVDLPHPLVPHNSTVTDSFLSLILMYNIMKLFLCEKNKILMYNIAISMKRKQNDVDVT